MNRRILAGAAVVATIGVVPAHAQTISLSTVLAHTRAANVALARAVAAFNAHAYGAGSQALAKNRSQIGLAVSQTAHLIQAANDPASRLAAAKAVVAVAKQEGADQRALAAAERQLRRGGLLQDRTAAAVNADTHRAANAVAKLQALMPLLPAHAQAGIANAFSHVTAAHRSAVAQLARDTTTPTVGRIAKNQAAADIAADVAGQAHAVGMLNAIASSLPPSAQNGIQTAIAALQHNLAVQAARLTATKPHAPRRLRPTIANAIAIAKKAANG
jgi:hypothetical protein